MRFFRTGLFILFILFLAHGACAVPRDELDDNSSLSSMPLQGAAEEALHLGHNEECVRLCRLAIKKSPDYNFDLYFLAGRALLAMGLYNDALGYFEDAVATTFDDGMERCWGHSYVGLVLLRKKCFQDALVNYRIALKPGEPHIPPHMPFYDNYSVYRDAGFAAFQEKEYREALGYYRKALLWKSSAPWEVYLNAARSALKSEQYDLSYGYFEVVLKEASNPSWDIFYDMGVSAFKFGMCEEAFQCFDKAIKQKANLPLFVYFAASAAAYTVEDEKAFSSFSHTAKKIYPDETEAIDQWFTEFHGLK